MPLVETTLPQSWIIVSLNIMKIPARGHGTGMRENLRGLSMRISHHHFERRGTGMCLTLLHTSLILTSAISVVVAIEVPIRSRGRSQHSSSPAILLALVLFTLGLMPSCYGFQSALPDTPVASVHSAHLTPEKEKIEEEASILMYLSWQRLSHLDLMTPCSPVPLWIWLSL